jgi:integrase
MRGHIRQRSPGHWAIVIDVKSDSGRRKRKWHSFKGTKRQAQDECTRLLRALQTGDYVEPNKVTLAEFFDRWLHFVKPNVSPRTYEGYEEYIRLYLKPALGAKPLRKLQAIDISQAYATAHTSGRRDGKGGLSGRTILHIHRVLSRALKQAVRWKLIVSNPCAELDKKDRPKVVKKSVATITAAETVQIVEAARAKGLLIPFLLGSLAGLRRGEIVALRWKSVDLDRGELTVAAAMEHTRVGGSREKEVKGGRSRTIAMPGMLVDELKRHRVAQAEQMLRLGIRTNAESFVLMKPDGSNHLNPRSLSFAITSLMRRQGSKVRLHGLRHSHASQLLAEGVHPKVVQERLGHASISITMDIYSHVMPNMQAEAAAKIDEALKAAQMKNGSPTKR